MYEICPSGSPWTHTPSVGPRFTQWGEDDNWMDLDTELPMKGQKSGSKESPHNGLLLCRDSFCGQPWSSLRTALSVVQHTAAGALLCYWKPKRPLSHFRDDKKSVTCVYKTEISLNRGLGSYKGMESVLLVNWQLRYHTQTNSGCKDKLCCSPCS